MNKRVIEPLLKSRGFVKDRKNKKTYNLLFDNAKIVYWDHIKTMQDQYSSSIYNLHHHPLPNPVWRR